MSCFGSPVRYESRLKSQSQLGARRQSQRERLHIPWCPIGMFFPIAASTLADTDALSLTALRTSRDGLPLSLGSSPTIHREAYSSSHPHRAARELDRTVLDDPAGASQEGVDRELGAGVFDSYQADARFPYSALDLTPSFRLAWTSASSAKML